MTDSVPEAGQALLLWGIVSVWLGTGVVMSWVAMYLLTGKMLFWKQDNGQG